MCDGASEVVVRHSSPDRALTWIVKRYRDRNGEFDFAFGFETDDSLWHSHPEALEARGRSREQIARDLTDDLLNDRFVIKTTIRDGEKEHALLVDLETEVDYLIGNDERVSLRFWSGREVTFEQLIEGRVPFRPFNG